MHCVSCLSKFFWEEMTALNKNITETKSGLCVLFPHMQVLYSGKIFLMKAFNHKNCTYEGPLCYPNKIG